MSLSLEEMKAITYRFAEEPWSEGKLETFDELCAPNYRIGEDGTLQDIKNAVVSYRKSFPDLKLDILEMLADGDLVAYRWTMTGTHLGELDGIAPTGAVITGSGITIIRFANGKIVHDQFGTVGKSAREQILAASKSGA